ncbi:esterase [Coccidioides immitis RS]|uniref:Esterase n=1 Tax=Coccidioides immitis (strain RS) TaxID=246410 RepID=J3K6Z2_COCIM|nr:esterase [Coccidioides immitis RS]EAS30394.3 esterase [Coccidioides immitis RS]
MTATDQQPAGDPALHKLKPGVVYQPLLNSIPPQLLPRFDPVYVEHYNRYNVGRLHTHQIPIEEFRANPQKYQIVYGRAAAPDIYKITEQKCSVKGGEITIRIFEPKPIQGADGKPKKRGSYINFHGGGWVFGSLIVDHHSCKRIVHDLGGDAVVFDVDYRLAPEYKYPTAIEDCWAAFQWVRSKAEVFNLDTNRMAVGGASAGGHLAAVVAHLCRDNEFPLSLQILTVPVTDMHSSFTPDGKFDRENTPYESYREMEFTPALPAERMAYFHRHWLGVLRPEKSDDDWKISPILAPNFANLAPALVWTAEMDPLRDEGEAYAAKMKAAGVQVELIRVPGVPHTFSGLDEILESAKMFRRKCVEELRKSIGG